MATNGSFNTSAYQNRYLTFSWVEKSQSIEKNTTTISWTLKGGGSASGYYLTQNITVKIAGEVVFQHTKAQNGQIKLYNGTDVASGTYTFTHNTDGSKNFQVYVEAGIYVWEPNCNGTKTFTLNTIPRASALTVGKGTLGEAMTLKITSASSSFKHRITYKCGNAGGGITTSGGYITAESVAWTPPLSLASQNTSGTSVTVVFTLDTYTSDGTKVGSTSETALFVIPSSVVPKCKVTWEDTTSMTDTYGNPVQGLSKLKVKLETETAYGSKIATYSVTANGVKYTKAEFTTGVLKTEGKNNINATIKDMRGRTAGAGAIFDVLAYTAPVVSLLTVHRCNADGTENDQGNYVKATFSAAVTNLNGKNKPTYKLRRKAATASSYTETTLTGLANTYTVTNYEYIFEADSNSSYDVEVTVSDNHSTAGRATSASTAFTLINWHESGTGMGIGKVSEKENTLEVGLDAYFRAGVYGSVYGLDTLPDIIQDADFNDYVMPGVYAVKENAIAATLKNRPCDLAGRLIVSTARGIRGSNKVFNLEQKFIPYTYGRRSQDVPTYVRYLYRTDGGALTAEPWFNEALKAYPVGSIHMRYDTQNPADLFGGTWVQITARVLRAGSAGSIGAEGDIASGSGRTYIDVAVWRRTA